MNNIIKFFILFFLYILFISKIYSQNSFKIGIFQNGFFTYYKEGLKKEKNIQKIYFVGFPLHFNYEYNNFF